MVTALRSYLEGGFGSACGIGIATTAPGGGLALENELPKAVGLAIPEALSSKWQPMADILASVSEFTAALIMRSTPDELEVCVSSNSVGNPYKSGEKILRNTGLYCESVIKTKLPLYVCNALIDPDWNTNPDIELGMICYFGLVLLWPNGQPFGTICVLDQHERRLPPECEKLMYLMREVIEADLKRLTEGVEEAMKSSAMLQDAEGRFAAIFQQAAIGIARVGLDGRWLEVNDRLCDIVGYGNEELRSLTFQEITHQDDLDSDLNLLKQVLDGDISTYTIEKRYLHKQGHVVWVILTVSLVCDCQNSPHYFVSVVHDITEKKFLRREIEQSQKLEAMGRLVGGMAHEFNNKLSAITGNLFLATKRPESYQAYVKDAERLCFQASEMIDSLLSYARKAPSEKIVVSLGPFLKDVFKSYQVVVPENVCFSFEFGEEPMLLRANATQIQQIVVNLINNAIDAVQGVVYPEIVVILSRMKASPDFKKRHHNINSDYVAQITVTDNGIGMRGDEFDRIFDPFYTTKPIGKGTGLGLAMVASLVEQHGGAVDVESDPGNGTQFFVYLPLIEENLPTNSQSPVRHLVGAGDGQTILVVDDNESVLKVTSEVLESLGYNVLTARDGRQALSIYASGSRISCVLTDVVMPIMGGVELYNRLRAIDQTAKVVFMTGHDSRDNVASLRAPVLSKPIAIAELTAALHKLLH